MRIVEVFSLPFELNLTFGNALIYRSHQRHEAREAWALLSSRMSVLPVGKGLMRIFKELIAPARKGC
jgi:hypothetical protein